VDHLRAGNEKLARLLEESLVVTHPFVIGELALGCLRRRKPVLEALADLPRAAVASDAEALNFIEQCSLFGRGIGYVDAHLLASARLTAGASLWTIDKRLHQIAAGLDLASRRR
jgi:predicted nucleic acid-binding protein